MRISHKHKFIYISITKTASTVVRSFLNPYSDVKSVHGSGNPLYHHVTMNRLKKHFEKRRWKWYEYYKMTLVRNPYSRIVSQYFYFIKLADRFTRPDDYPDLPRDDTEFINRCIRISKIADGDHKKGFKTYIKDSDYWSFHQPLQHMWINDDINLIGKQENIQGFIRKICDKFPNIEYQELEAENRTSHDDYTSYYDRRTVNLVNLEYKYDLERFNYKFGD